MYIFCYIKDSVAGSAEKSMDRLRASFRRSRRNTLASRSGTPSPSTPSRSSPSPNSLSRGASPKTPGRVQFSPRSSRKSSVSPRSMKSTSSIRSSESHQKNRSPSPRSPHSPRSPVQYPMSYNRCASQPTHLTQSNLELLGNYFCGALLHFLSIINSPVYCNYSIAASRKRRKMSLAGSKSQKLSIPFGIEQRRKSNFLELPCTYQFLQKLFQQALTA